MPKAYQDAAVPEELRGLAALLLLVGAGRLDDLCEQGFEVSSYAAARLAAVVPGISFDSRDGSFQDTEDLPTDLDPELLTALLSCDRLSERRDMSDQERCFERLSALAAYLLENGDPQRSLGLLRLTGQLLSVDKSASRGLGPVGPAAGSSAAGDGIAAGDGGGPASSANATAHASAAGGGKPASSLAAGNHPAASCLTPGSPTIVEPPRSNGVAALLRVRLFGDMEVELDGQMLYRTKLTRGLIRTLLSLLVINQGKGLARDDVIDWLWPMRDPAKAIVGFYNLWYRLCGALPSHEGRCPYFSNDEHLLRIDTRFVQSDVAEFERLARQVLFNQGSLEERFAAIDRIEQLYQNDILAGSAAHSRIQAAQVRYRGLLLDVLQTASKLYMDAGNNNMALWYAQRAFDFDDKREDIYRQLMSVLEANGQRTVAMNAYFDLRRYLDDELGILPSKQITALYQDIILDGS